MVIINDLKKEKRIIFLALIFFTLITFLIFKNFISILICILLYIDLISRLIKINKFLKSIIISDFEKLNTNIIAYRKNNYLFSKNFIFDYSTFDIIYYQDIICIYNKIKLMGSSFSSDIVKNIIIVTKNKKYIFKQESFNDWICDLKYKNLSEIIIAKNPNVLVGKTKENKKILEEQYGMKI